MIQSQPQAVHFTYPNDIKSLSLLSRPLSGVCKYPDRCQGFAGTLTVVRACRNTTLTQRLPGLIIRRHTACTRVPHRDGNSMGGSPLWNKGIRSQLGCRERQSFARDKNPGIPDPRHSTSSPRLSLPHTYAPKQGDDARAIMINVTQRYQMNAKQ